MNGSPDARLLIEHASFVRRVARGILTDEDAAEDVVQGTFLQALRHPPRSSSLHSWLARVARNLAISRWRAERGRSGRELAAARPERVSGPEDAVQRLEMQRRVVEAVMGLDEPYRMAIVHRYFEDLSTVEIAAHLRIPVPTVRTRLKRALAQLRARLEEPFGRDRHALFLALAPVAALPRRMGPRTALIAGGAALVKAKAILTVGVVLLGAALYLISSHRVREPSRAAGSEHFAVAARAGGGEAHEAPQAPSPSGIDAREASAKLVVGGIVRAAAEEALIEIRPETSRETPGDLIARATVPTGVPFEIPAVDLESAPLALLVSARCAGHVPGEARTVVLLDARTREPRVPPVELTLVRAATLSGQVVDAHGAPIRAATMAAFPSRNGEPAKTAVDATECDAEGRFELQVGKDGEYVVVAMSPGARPASCSVEARGGTIADVPALQLEAGEQVGGRVTVTGGAPAAKAKVGAALRSPGMLRLRIPRRDLEIAWCEGRAEWRFVSGLTDDDGRYRVSGLGRGPYQVALLGVDGGHPALTSGGSTPDALEHLSGGWEELDEHLGIRPGLSREVRPSAQGVDFDVAVAMVEFLLVPGGAPPGEARLEVAVVEGIVSIENDYPVGAALRTELIVAPGARLRVRAVAEGYQPQDVEIAAPAAGVREAHRIDLVPAPAKAALVIALEPQGLGPLPALPTAFTVYLFRADRRRDDPAAYRHLSIHNPEIVMKDLDEGTFRLEVFPGSMDQREHNFYRKAVTDVTLRAGEATHLSLPLHPGGRLRILVQDPEGQTNVAAGCRIVGPDGQVVPANFAKFEGRGTSMSTGGLPGSAGPAEVMEPLVPGLYVIRVEPLDTTLQPKTLTAEIGVGRLTVAKVGLDR